LPRPPAGLRRGGDFALLARPIQKKGLTAAIYRRLPRSSCVAPSVWNRLRSP
jgi:hypothetical protein